jgi:N-methylhydantoinase A/oxoprolinase/acetone carboxylase beta subunit
VTDANVVLGHLAPGASLAGVELDADAARAAVGRLAAELGLGLEETAAGIVRIANLEMVGALRVVSVERGIDPRDHTLVSFGGAGGLHAAAIAAELGMRRILCPAEAGVLSAFGLIASEERRDLARTLLLGEDAIADGRLAAAVEALRGELADERTVAVEVVFEVRYRGQSFELDVDPGPGLEHLRDAFEAEHERRYGYRDPDAAIEIVGIRGAALGAQPELPRGAGSTGGALGEEGLAGPAVVELPETTLLVPPGATARCIGAGGDIEILLAEAGS